MSATQQLMPEPLSKWLHELELAEWINAQELESGGLVSQVMKKTIDGYIPSLNNSSSAVQRVSNWQNLITELKGLNIRVTQDEKTKIINGNKELICHVISKLKDHHMRAQQSKQVDISKISARSEMGESVSLLELLILAIVRNFNLSTKESVALLSNDSKYLAHILAKGLKGDFRPIHSFLADLQSHVDLVCHFCTKNKQNQTFFIRAVKPALISKSDSVSLNSLQLLNRYLTIACEVQSKQAHKYEIVAHDLLSTLILATKRHPHLLTQILQFILQQTAYNTNILKDLLKELPDSQSLENESQEIVITILSICRQTDHISDFFRFKGLKEVMDALITNLRNVDTVLNSMDFLIELITEDQSEVSEFVTKSPLLRNIEQVSNSFPKQLDEARFITQLFCALWVWGHAKNPVAPSIFKLLLGKYYETINPELVELFMVNFTDIVSEFPTIPFSLIVEAVNKRIEWGKQMEVGQAELDFFMLVLNNQEVDEKTALIIYNAVSKLLIEQTTYAKRCGDILLIVLRKFGQKEAIFYDMTCKFVKVCLAVHYANAKKLWTHKKKPVASTELEDIMTKSQNLFLQSYLDQLMKEAIEEINSSVQPLLCFSLIQVENYGKVYGVGLRRVISRLGDPDSVTQKYVEEVKKIGEENHSKTKSTNKKSKLKEVQEIKKYITDSAGNANAQHVKQSLATNKISKFDHLVLEPGLGVTPHAQKGLDKYHRAYLSKLQKQEREQMKERQLQQRQQKLKKLFERKMLDNGIEVKKIKDEDYQSIYEFGAKEKEMKHDTTKMKVELPLYQPEDEEDRDIKGLESTIKRYQRVFKLYYNLYSGHVKAKNLDSFDQIASKYNLLYPAGVVRMFKEHTLDEFISIRELQILSKKINIKLDKQFDDATSLDYQGFQQLIIQASYVMFTRAPKDLSGHPVSEMVEETISRLKLYANDNKVDEKLFDDPENVYFNETEAVGELNRKLSENPDYILPEGYKKIVEKRVIYTHRIYLDAISQPYKDVIELISELLEQSLGIHLIEPFTTEEAFARARPALYYKQRQEGEVNTQKLSMYMKKLVAKIPIKQREIAKQAAGVIEEITEAVEQGHNRVGLKYQNRAQRDRKLEEQQRRKRIEEEKKKRNDRDRQIKSALVKHKEVTTQKQQQEKRKEKEHKRQQQELRKKREDEQRRLKHKVEQYQQKKKQDEQRRKKEQKQAKKKQREEAQRKKKQLEQTKRQLEQRKQIKQQQEEAKRKKQEEQEKKLRLEQKKRNAEEQRKKKQMVEEYKNSKSMAKSGVNSSMAKSGVNSSKLSQG